MRSSSATSAASSQSSQSSQSNSPVPPAAKPLAIRKKAGGKGPGGMMTMAMSPVSSRGYAPAGELPCDLPKASPSGGGWVAASSPVASSPLAGSSYMGRHRRTSSGTSRSWEDRSSQVRAFLYGLD